MKPTARRCLRAGLGLALAGSALAGCVLPPPVPGSAVARRAHRHAVRSSVHAAAAVVRHAPPPPKLEVRKPRRPSSRHVWVHGRWSWSGHRWVWVSGHWSVPPSRKRAWVKGHWKRSGRGYVYVPGHWR